MNASYPCPKCGKSRKWVPCPDQCGTGMVQMIDDKGKMIGMMDCPTCTRRGHRRMGGQIVCPHCGEKEVVPIYDPVTKFEAA